MAESFKVSKSQNLCNNHVIQAHRRVSMSHFLVTSLKETKILFRGGQGCAFTKTAYFGRIGQSRWPIDPVVETQINFVPCRSKPEATIPD